MKEKKKQEGSLPFCKQYGKVQKTKCLSLPAEPAEQVLQKEKFFSYISGFVDGEGCFSVSFRFLKKSNFGIEMRPSFSIAQKENFKNYQLLDRIKIFFECGGIRKDGTGCYKYETRSLVSLNTKIIPFFEKYTLHTSKVYDFILFRDICSIMATGGHKKREGILQILELASQMNSSGKRKYTIDKLKAMVLSAHKK